MNIMLLISFILAISLKSLGNGFSTICLFRMDEIVRSNKEGIRELVD